MSPGRTGSSGSSQLLSAGEIDTLVILDREVDLFSSLVTPLTYEGLLDEIVGIENSRYSFSQPTVSRSIHWEIWLAMIEYVYCLLTDHHVCRIRVDASLLADEGESLNLKMPANMMAEPVQAAAAVTATVKRLPGEKVAIQLKSALDPIFAGIRDLSIEGLGPFLRDRSI